MNTEYWPICSLEHVWFSFIDGTSLSVWTKPNCLASALRAKGALAPDKAIDESLTEHDMGRIGAKWLSTDGPVFEF